MIRLRFRFQQLVAADLALRVQLADFCLVRVGQTAGHWSGRNEDCRQMAEMQRTDQQTRHNLVAHAKIDCGIEHVMRQRDRGGHRDSIAREQRQLHAWLPLRDAIAHRRHTTRKLRHAASLAHCFLDHLWEMFKRLMRGEHIVIGRNDCD